MYDIYFQAKKLNNNPLFNTYNLKKLKIDNDEFRNFEFIWKLTLKEYRTVKGNNYDKIINLIDILLIDMARYITHYQYQNISSYNEKLNNLYSLIEKHYKDEKQITFYSEKLNISQKHLNRICQTLLNKTASSILSQRIILEAKRLLINKEFTINNVAEELGFFEISYFSKYFKKYTLLTPSIFRLKGRNHHLDF